MAAEAASLESSIAPSSDSSASRLCGGTRRAAGRRGGPERAGAGVVEGLDHGLPYLAELRPVKRKARN